MFLALILAFWASPHPAAVDSNEVINVVGGLKVHWVLQAIVEVKRPNGFTTTKYRRSVLPNAITNATLLRVPAYIDGVDMSKMEVGDKWLGSVDEIGLITNRATGTVYHHYVVRGRPPEKKQE